MARTTADLAEPEPYRLAASASHLLHRAEQLVGDTITLRQFVVLAAIAEAPGLSQSELVRATGIDRSTIADMMMRMGRSGWIARTPSPTDARAQSVNLTADGAKLLASATHHARAADAAILDALPRTKARTLLNILTKLAKLVDEANEKQSAKDAKKKRKRTRKKDARASSRKT